MLKGGQEAKNGACWDNLGLLTGMGMLAAASKLTSRSLSRAQFQFKNLVFVPRPKQVLSLITKRIEFTELIKR